MTTSGWTTKLKAAGVNRFCTRIEIKPHTKTGIHDGINQLLGARWGKIKNPKCAAGQSPKLFLFSYLLQPWPSAEATIHILEVTPAAQSVIQKRGWQLASLPFKQLGTVDVPDANTTVLRRDCPTLSGEAMETAIRRHYQDQMNLIFKTRLTLQPKAVSTTGPDIDHEFAEFLAELAGELADH